MFNVRNFHESEIIQNAMLSFPFTYIIFVFCEFFVLITSKPYPQAISWNHLSVLAHLFYFPPVRHCLTHFCYTCHIKTPTLTRTMSCPHGPMCTHVGGDDLKTLAELDCFPYYSNQDDVFPIGFFCSSVFQHRRSHFLREPFLPLAMWNLSSYTYSLARLYRFRTRSRFL